MADYKLSTIKSKVYPEMKDVIKYIDLALESDETIRDIRPAVALMTRMMIVNTRLRGFVLKRKTAVNAYSWEIRGEDKNKIAAVKKRLKSAIEKIKSEFWKASGYGRFGAKCTWQNLPELGQTPSLSFIKPLELDAYGDYYALVDLNGNKTKIEKSEAYLLMSEDSYLLGCIFTEMFRWNALQELQNFIKKLKGILQVIDKGASDETADIATQAAQNAVQNNVMVTDDTIEVKFNSITGTVGSSFNDTIDGLNNDIAIGILGQANTAELPSNGGSRAALLVMSLVSYDIHITEAQLLENFINEQLLKYDSLLNYGVEPDYEFRIKLEEDKNLESIVAAVQGMLDTGLAFLESEVYSLFGMSIPSDGDKTVQKSSNF